MTLSDRALNRSFAALYERYADEAVGLAYLVTGDRRLEEDLMQVDGNVCLATAQNVTLAADSLTSDGWYPIKDIWVVDGSYEGPVLIRGGRVDGEGTLLLAWNPMTPMQDFLVIDPSSPSLQMDPTTGWRSVPTEAFVRSPGCYAYQLDGAGFTSYIVFEASASARGAG